MGRVVTRRTGWDVWLPVGRSIFLVGAAQHLPEGRGVFLISVQASKGSISLNGRDNRLFVKIDQNVEIGSGIGIQCSV